jgi:hypothetical protein
VRIVLLAASLTTIGLGGCPGFGSSGPECSDGVSCLSGEVCANTHECLPADEVHPVVVHWTVNGQPPTATLCRNNELELTISSLGSGASLSYAPVLCSTGQFNFDKLPTYYDQVALTVTASGAVTSASIPAAGGDVFLDLVQ